MTGACSISHRSSFVILRPSSMLIATFMASLFFLYLNWSGVGRSDILFGVRFIFEHHGLHLEAEKFPLI